MITDEIAAKPPIKLGVYRHYKGNLYQVVDLVCHSETLEWLVLYVPLYDHDGMPDKWVRPFAMFVEEIELEGKKVPRFEYIDNLD